MTFSPCSHDLSHRQNHLNSSKCFGDADYDMSNDDAGEIDEAEVVIGEELEGGEGIGSARTTADLQNGDVVVYSTRRSSRLGFEVSGEISDQLHLLLFFFFFSRDSLQFVVVYTLLLSSFAAKFFCVNMHEITEFTDNRNSSEQDGEAGTMPKNDILDLPPDKIHSRHIGSYVTWNMDRSGKWNRNRKADNVASSSGTNLRSSFIGMGFSQSLVDKVIEEKGEDDVDLLLETLFAYSALQKPQSESSDSLDGLFCDKKDEIAADSHPKEVLHKQNSKSSDSLESLFGDDKDTSCSPNIAGEMCPKEETDIHNAVNDDRRASLLMMNFSLDEINFAMEKLGEDAPVNELVDFIFAAQVSEHQAHDKDNTCHGNEERNKEASKLITDKTLRLLEMGFSENQISAAIEKYGGICEISIQLWVRGVVRGSLGRWRALQWPKITGGGEEEVKASLERERLAVMNLEH
ncbi:hypothetical protein TEA_009387 [Camellia sinensis var. sinensis]|uniref:UBA domain-containing protein n=1 Tax=Camellia sinensis var. sinensis TaxID=542762 RepID=A0A4S4D189_CAMSN|nr:hypothetical protein TEA_009387 [Camellia sinensis var. sinensis]